MSVGLSGSVYLFPSLLVYSSVQTDACTHPNATHLRVLMCQLNHLLSPRMTEAPSSSDIDQKPGNTSNAVLLMKDVPV